jgi:hypothetical protein
LTVMHALCGRLPAHLNLRGVTSLTADRLHAVGA